MSKSKTPVLDLLRNDKKWTKCVYATDGLLPCHPEDKLAKTWCLIGAISKGYPTRLSSAKAKKKVAIAIAKLFPEFNSCYLATFNDADKISHADIVRVLEEA